MTEIIYSRSLCANIVPGMVYAILGTLMFFFSAAVLLCNIVITYFNLGISFSCLKPHTIMA